MIDCKSQISSNKLEIKPTPTLENLQSILRYKLMSLKCEKISLISKLNQTIGKRFELEKQISRDKRDYQSPHKKSRTKSILEIILKNLRFREEIKQFAKTRVPEDRQKKLIIAKGEKQNILSKIWMEREKCSKIESEINALERKKILKAGRKEDQKKKQRETEESPIKAEFIDRNQSEKTEFTERLSNIERDRQSQLTIQGLEAYIEEEENLKIMMYQELLEAKSRAEEIQDENLKLRELLDQLN